MTPARHGIAWGLTLAALVGCVPAPPAPGLGPVPVLTESDLRIAADLVGVLARVEALAPGRAPATSVRERPGERGFARALAIALVEAGYEVVDGGARGAAGRGGTTIEYTVLRGLDGASLTATYTVDFADVAARRDWSLSPGTRGAPGSRWVPTGPVLLRGADVASLSPVPPPTPP